MVQKPAEPEPTGFVTAYLKEARGKLTEGDTAASRAAVDRALERDPNSLAALQLLAEIAQGQSDLSLHRWLDVHDTRFSASNGGRAVLN